jgi:DNA-binding NarL/FixJ family response regulator
MDMQARSELTSAEWSIVTRMRDPVRTTEGIAYELGVNESTVRKHLENAYKKLGVHSRKEMIDKFNESIVPKNRTLVLGVWI